MQEETAKTIARKLLGGALVFAGISHLTFARKEFQAQVPDWVPLRKDDTVVLSGIAEIALGSTVALVGPTHQKAIGRIAAAFFTAVFPGNLSQYINHRNAFGLNTDNKRFARLFFQPLLIAWALWSTDAPAYTKQPQRISRLGRLYDVIDRASRHIPVLGKNV